MTTKTKGRNGGDRATQNESQRQSLYQPTVIAKTRRGRECWILEITCPHCGKRHTHGGGSGHRPFGGHRVSHCATPGGYIIELDIEEQGGSDDELC